jgi:hypothetical protein
MRRKRVASTAISSVGYDEGSSTLELEFKSGSIYDYHGVPPDVYRDLMEADSKGRFVSREIRGRYPATRLGE